MSLRIIAGRAGTGKSRRCLDEIREALQSNPEGHPLVLLVPEQSTFQAEYALVRTPGLPGMLRAQALSFRRLALRVMQETGGSARIHIDESGKSMLLYRQLRQSKEELKLFRNLADQPGFVDKLNELFTEFRRYGIDAIQLEEQVRGALEHQKTGALLTSKLEDLLLIYKAFESDLSRHYIDSEDDLALLAARLEQSEFVRSAEIWIDGFHGFTPREYEVIARLMQNARRVSIALCVDRMYEPGESLDELNPFHPTAVTMLRLMEIAAQYGIELEDKLLLGGSPERIDFLSHERFNASPALAVLEHCLVEGTASIQAAPNFALPRVLGSLDEQLVVCEAANRRAETEGVAREMLRLVREHGARWRDMAVLVRDYEGYGDLLAVTFTDYGIPHFFDQKRPLLHHPLVEFIRSALETATNNWRYDSVFRCVKTQFLLPLPWEKDAARLNRSAMDRLENIVLAFGIHGSRWTDDKPWPVKRNSSLEGEDIRGTAGEGAEAQLMEECRRRVARPLKGLADKLKSSSNVREMTEALFGLLVDVKAFERLGLWQDECTHKGQAEQAREHSQIWDRIIHMLDQIAELMGEESMDADSFAGVIESGLAALRMGLVPPALDQVLIGSMDRTRSSRIRYAFVLGANDGVMPKAMDEGGVLAENEREWLTAAGLELAPGSRRKLLDERFIMYTAFTVPSHMLWISYPMADQEGKSMLPSEIVKQILKWFPQLKRRSITLEPEHDEGRDGAESHQAYLSSPGKALSHLIVQLREWRKGVPIPELWWETYNWFVTHPMWSAKLRTVARSLFYINQESPLRPETNLLLYGDHLRTSVSRMEMFVACPFSHFAAYGLRLSERPVYRLESPDIGQLFHSALRHMTEELIQEGVLWSQLSVEECEARASVVVDRLAPRLAGEILLSSKRFGYIARKLKRIVGRAAAVLGEHARRGQFVPIGLELGFGPGQQLPPLSFQLHNGVKMEVVGRIDRVDRADSQQGVLLRVIDYKSSALSLRMDEVYHGLALQMLTYLDVVVQNAEQWLGQASKPAGVLYFHVHNPMLSGRGPMPVKDAEDALFKQFKMKGLVSADPETVQLMDSSLGDKGGRSSIIPVGLKGSGEFYKGSSVVTEQQWSALRQHVRRKINKAGTEITDGRVEIAPYKLGDRTPCGYCSYRTICQFDRAQTGNDYRTFRSMGAEAIWKGGESDE
jgi:ATP-dependent helicase/nuclease subunit B